MNSFRSTSKSRITDFGLIDNPSKQCRHILCDDNWASETGEW